MCVYIYISNPLVKQDIYSEVDMGSCISSASSEIHAVDYGHGNLVYYQDSNYTDEFQKFGSIFSHQGSKGLNQDAAILHQVWHYEQKKKNHNFDLFIVYIYIYYLVKVCMT